MRDSNKQMVAELFRDLLPIEWMGMDMYFSEDIYFHIPYLIYRYEEGYDEIYQSKLSVCIEEFNGKQKWCTFRSLVSRHKNYLLTLQVVYEKMKECKEANRLYNGKEEFGEGYYKLCEEAIEDIPSLAQHIESHMR